MANKRITDLTEITSLEPNAVIEVVDTTDTTDSPDGSSFKIKKSNLIKAGFEESTSNIELSNILYKSYGDDTVRTGDITILDSSSFIGYYARIIHNDTIPPNILSDFDIIFNGLYIENTRNDIYLFMSSENELTVTYTQPENYTPEYRLPLTTLNEFTRINNSFVSTTSAVYGAYGWLNDVYLGDCFIQYVYKASVSKATVISINETTQTTFSNLDRYFFVDGAGGLQRGELGTNTVLGYTVLEDDIIRMERIGDDILLKTSSDAGLNFTTRHTYTSVGFTNNRLIFFANGLGKELNDVEIQVSL